MASREEAEADPGWPALVDFLRVAGLEDGPLERTLTLLLATEDVTNVGVLRSCFSELAPRLKIGTRKVIGGALAATPSASGPQQPCVEQSPVPLPPVAFNVVVSFDKQEATVPLRTGPSAEMRAGR